MRSLLIGIGLIGLIAADAAAQPVPTPAPRPKSSVAPPPAAAPSGTKPQAQLTPAQSQGGGSFFPFKVPGFGQPGAATAFDANQRALIDRVNVYLMSIQLLTGDFVQVGSDGRRVVARSEAGADRVCVVSPGDDGAGLEHSLR